MKSENSKRISEVALFLLLFLGVFFIIGLGSFKETGSLSPLWDLIRGLILPFSFVIVLISLASIIQKYVLKKFDAVLLDFSKSNHLKFNQIEYSLLNNPGEGSSVIGQYHGFNVFLRGFFHGYQLGRKSFVVEIDSVSSPTKILFSNNKHKFPKLDFWNSKKIPSFSSFLCEHGPMVRLKNAHVIELPKNIGKTHYLVSEKKEYGLELISKKALESLTNLRGAVYLDGDKLYYGQQNLPKNKEEIAEIVESLTKFASKLK